MNDVVEPEGADTVACADSPDGADSPDDADLAAVAAQLGRHPRGVLSVAHRCPCALPDVVATAPRLPDGTPFPTYYYLTCPRLAGAIGTLEAAGVMRSMTERLGTDASLAEAHAEAHQRYLAAREAVESVPQLAGVSAGGMPDRVKCLHVLVAHSLAAGPGANPLGDEALAMLPDWWRSGPCVGVGVDAGEDGDSDGGVGP